MSWLLNTAVIVLAEAFPVQDVTVIVLGSTIDQVREPLGIEVDEGMVTTK